ncbi:MAG: YkgJ family cysteine cluster protein [Deltaproteobacteria bacterium]|nr:YkgJ family cysteine cluster protein [Deltaproteobacteria bacterium]
MELKPFECQLCGTCCKGEGGVFITEEELPGIARYLNSSVEDFERNHCLRKNGRIYIRTRADGYCSLWDGGCLVHPVKPRPCKEWPFFKAMMRDRSNWEVAKENCPGVNPDATYEEFQAQGRSETESES